MQTILQEVGATLIGGTIFIVLLTLNARIGDTAQAQSFKTVVEETSATATDIMERDLRLIGYGVADTAYILKADSVSITFREDVDDNGKPDTIAYAISKVSAPGSAASSSVLKRTLGTQAAVTIATGVTQFAYDYYDKLGNPTKTVGKIRSITMSMTTVSDSDVDNTHPGVYWERTIKPKNMR